MIYNIVKVLYFTLAGIALWAAISSNIQRFKCTKMTETELFLHVPKSFVCDWQYCN